MDRMSERALDLLRRNRKRLGRPIQHHADALPARAQLPDALEQALRVAHRRHVGIGDQEHLIGRVQRRHRAGIDLTAGVDDDVVVLPREQPEQFFERPRVLRARPIELIGARQDVEPRLVLDHQLLEELAVEPVQVVDRIENGEPGTDPEEQRHFAEARFQVEDNGRPLAQTRDLDGTVDAERGRPRPAFRAEEHQRRRRRPRALRALAACREPADGVLERLLDRRPGEELVGPGPHRLKNQIRIRRLRDRENAGVRRRAAHPFDVRHGRRCIAADIDDDDVGRRAVAGDPFVGHADRNRPRSQQAIDLLLESFVFADDEADELRHVLSVSAGRGARVIEPVESRSEMI